MTMDLTGCPECGAPAEVVDRYSLPAAGSPPVEHVATACVNRHHLVQATN